MQNYKKSKKYNIEKLHKILDNISNRDLPPQNEKYLKALSKRLGESYRQDIIFKKLVTKEKDEKEIDSMKPKVTIYPREVKKVIEFKEIEEEKLKIKIEEPSEVSPLPQMELKYQDEDIFEVEKVEVSEPEFIQVIPKKVERVEKEKAIEEKKVIPDEDLPEWKPVETELEKTEELIEEPFEEKKAFAEEELTEWEPVEIEIETVKKEIIEDKEKPKVTIFFCGQCGAKLEEMVKFCPECGNEIYKENEEFKIDKPEHVEKEEPIPVFIPVKKVEEKEEILKIEKETAAEELEIKKREAVEKLDAKRKIKIKTFRDIDSIDDETAVILYNNGFTTIDSIAIASIKDLSKIKGIKRKTAKKIKNEINQNLEWKPLDIEKIDIRVKQDESPVIEPIPIEKTEKEEIIKEKIEFKDEIIDKEVKINAFKEINSIDDEIAVILYNNGFTTIDSIAIASIKDLSKIKGIKRITVKKIKNEIKQKFEWVAEDIEEDKNQESKVKDHSDTISKDSKLKVKKATEIDNEIFCYELVENKSDDVFKNIRSIDEKIAKLLKENEINSIDILRNTTIKDLTKIRGIKRKIAKEIKKEIEELPEDKKSKKAVSEELFELEKKPFIKEVGDESKSFDTEKKSNSKIKGIKGFKHGDFTLYKKEIDTKSGKKRIVRFFSKTEQEGVVPIELPKDYEVKENKKTGLPYLKKKK